MLSIFITFGTTLSPPVIAGQICKDPSTLSRVLLNRGPTIYRETTALKRIEGNSRSILGASL